MSRPPRTCPSTAAADHRHRRPAATTTGACRSSPVRNCRPSGHHRRIRSRVPMSRCTRRRCRPATAACPALDPPSRRRNNLPSGFPLPSHTVPLKSSGHTRRLCRRRRRRPHFLCTRPPRAARPRPSARIA